MNISEAVPWLILGLLLVGLVAFLFLPPRAKAGSSADRQNVGPVFRDDDRYWLGGFLYYNPDDPAVFVPKRYGLGRTLNMGHPLGKLIMAGLVLLGLLLALLNALAH